MTAKTILPIVVLYRCQLTESQSYQSLLRDAELSQFLVYDNSPADFHFDEQQLPPNAHYHRDTTNGGLSKAYNYAARFALQAGFTHLLLLDQDSLFPPNALSVYQSALHTAALLAPIMETDKGSPFSPVDTRGWTLKGAKLSAGRHPLRHFAPVNSGMCIQLSAFQKAGGYKESVRLDYADFTFIQRLSHIEDQFVLLPICVQQNFSNDDPSAPRLLQRLSLYLQSARHCDTPTLNDKLHLHYQVLRHVVAIFLKTRRLNAVALYFRHFLFSPTTP